VSGAREHQRGHVVVDMITKGQEVRQGHHRDLYLALLWPPAGEAGDDMVVKQITESKDGRQAVLEDLFWALLNSRSLLQSLIEV